MPGPITITEGPLTSVAECHLDQWRVEADTAHDAENLANEHLDAEHPEVADD